MNEPFSDEQIRSIGDVLGVAPKRETNLIRFEIDAGEAARRHTIEMYPNIPIGEHMGALVCVYTANANLQLQHCSGVIASDMMGEVTFVAEFGGKVSGLIVEKGGGCSLYANVDRALLSGDFTTLGPEVMMSGIALSLTELVLPEDESEVSEAESGE